ncbi:cellulase family glycosylhydrolase [Candidatus Poribacteria bacterium]
MRICVYLAILSLAASTAEKPSGGLGLTVDEDGTLLKDGIPYRGFGVNYFDAFHRVLLDPNNTSYEAGFRELASYGIPFARVMFTGFWPSNMKLYMESKEAYFQRMDAVVKSAEDNGIGLIPSLFWYDGAVPDIVAESRDQWGNPESKTHAFMRNYVREVVTRYKDSPAIWGWELGNEYNLDADLPNAAEHRPKIVPHLGTLTSRSERDDLTHEMLHTTFVEFAKEVRKYDPHRIISTGNSIPRASAWHQREENSWTRDNYEQTFEILAEQNPDPSDVISIHTYQDVQDRIPQMMEMSKKLKKLLFIGEFGVPDEGPEVEMAFANLLATIEKERVPLAALWVYDLDRQPGYTVTGSNARAYQLKALAEANKRIWEARSSE